MMQLMYFIDRKEWASEVPKDLPIYLISGNMDPVGEYGKGVQQVYKELLNAGVKDLSMKLYTDGHHDILKDIGKEKVYEDIVFWMEKHI
jgi:alpha-beta hydrolase superfamily lysophospholipase